MNSRRRHRTWVIGGVGLILCGVLTMAQASLDTLTSINAVRTSSAIIYALSVLLFAVGLSRDSGVVRRRPLGVIALALVGLWPLAGVVTNRALDAATLSENAAQTYVYLSLLISAGAALIAAVQIARSGIVPGPWRWAPLWVLSLHALAWAAPQIIFVSLRPPTVQDLVAVVQLLNTLATLSGTVGLGVLSVTLAAMQRGGSVDVFHGRASSAPPDAGA